MLRCPCGLWCLGLCPCLAATAGAPIASVPATVATATPAQVIVRSLGGLRKPICMDSPVCLDACPAASTQANCVSDATYTRECERSHACMRRCGKVGCHEHGCAGRQGSVSGPSR